MKITNNIPGALVPIGGALNVNTSSFCQRLRLGLLLPRFFRILLFFVSISSPRADPVPLVGNGVAPKTTSNQIFYLGTFPTFAFPLMIRQILKTCFVFVKNKITL